VKVLEWKTVKQFLIKNNSKYENFNRKKQNTFRLFKSLFRYATQRFKQTENIYVKSGDFTLRKIDDCLFAIYRNLKINEINEYDRR